MHCRAAIFEFFPFDKIKPRLTPPAQQHAARSPHGSRQATPARAVSMWFSRASRDHRLSYVIGRQSRRRPVHPPFRSPRHSLRLQRVDRMAASFVDHNCSCTLSAFMARGSKTQSWSMLRARLHIERRVQTLLCLRACDRVSGLVLTSCYVRVSRPGMPLGLTGAIARVA